MWLFRIRLNSCSLFLLGWSVEHTLSGFLADFILNMLLFIFVWMTLTIG